MSIKTWKEEFYPVPVKDFLGTEYQAVEHSIRKWTGLRQVNLDRHGCKAQFYASYQVGMRRYTGVIDLAEDFFGIDSDSCALCAVHTSSASGYANCSDCILKEITGDGCGLGDNEKDGWNIWLETGSPDLMIQNLKIALDKMTFLRKKETLQQFRFEVWTEPLSEDKINHKALYMRLSREDSAVGLILRAVDPRTGIKLPGGNLIYLSDITKDIARFGCVNKNLGIALDGIQWRMKAQE